jgi:excisionase family DNA binding protein
VNEQDDNGSRAGEVEMGDSVTLEAGGEAEAERLLITDEVAVMFRVDPKTVRRWVATGKVPSIRTPGGRDRRYREAEIRALIDSTDTGLGG